jgi:hypothetical protein
LGLFEQLADEDARAKSSTELAIKVGGDPVLIGELFSFLNKQYLLTGNCYN